MTYLAPTKPPIATCTTRGAGVIPGVAVCPRCSGYYVSPAYLTVIETDFNGEASDPMASPFSLALYECATCGYVGPICESTS